jgi:hypothetical protein
MVATDTFLCETGYVAVETPEDDQEGRGRKTLSIRADVGAEFKRVCKSKPVGRSMDDTATRLIQWFNRQRGFVRAAVTNDVDEGMEFAYITALRDMADELERQVTGEEATPPSGSEPDEAELSESSKADTPPLRRSGARGHRGRKPARGH